MKLRNKHVNVHTKIEHDMVIQNVFIITKYSSQ